ncbi:MAG: glycosyltransferase family 1 protein [Planctomycetota bacterium]
MPLPIAIDYRPALLSRAGIGRSVRELCRALSRCADLDVHLFGHSLARAKVPVEVPDAARLHRLPIAGRALPTLAKLGLGMDRLAGRARVVHWTDYVQPPVSRARTVLTVHDLAFARDPSWHGTQAAELLQRTKAAIARADAIVTPSRTTADDLRRFVPEAKPAHVIPFGADHVPRQRFADPLAGRPFALCVGTIEPRKNHLTLLAAWRALPAPRPLLVVAGAVGWACDDAVTALEQAAREGDVRWLRAADDATLWALLQHARLCVYPSLWEGFGFPPLEAMALGVPVVAHDEAPMRELGGGAIALCDARDAEALAATIQRALGDDAHRHHLIAAGRARAATFTWRACAEQHAQLYREVGAC